jgi:hypothetical protein
MKRLISLGLAVGLSALLFGCALESDDPTTEQIGEQGNGLHEGSGTVRGDDGDLTEEDLTGTADPNGPSPYPWAPENCNDPASGPSPYPWQSAGGDQGAGAGTGTGTDETDTGGGADEDTTGTTQKKTASGP